MAFLTIAWPTDALAKVLAINPRMVTLPRRRRRGGAPLPLRRRAVELTRKALRSIRETACASAELGAHLLRTGDEPLWRRSSPDRAFKADLTDVVPIQPARPARQPGFVPDAQMQKLVTMRCIRRSVGAVKEHALPLARDALATLGARYHGAARADSDRDCPFGKS